MTKLFPKTRSWAVCSHKSEQTVITSNNTHGSPDLDLCSPEMQRSTMRTGSKNAHIADTSMQQLRRLFQRRNLILKPQTGVIWS